MSCGVLEQEGWVYRVLQALYASYLTAPWVHTIRAEIGQFVRELISDVEGVWVRVVLHLGHIDSCFDSAKAINVIKTKVLVVNEALWKARCIVRQPAEQGATNFVCISYTLKIRNRDTSHCEALQIRQLPKLSPKNGAIDITER